MSDLDFRDRLSAYLNLQLDGRCDIARLARLAALFSLLTSSPLRWLAGTATAHPLLQKQILEFIANSTPASLEK